MGGDVAERVTRTGGRAATTGVIRGRYGLSVGKPEISSARGWQWTPLTELARLETGHTPSRKHKEYWGGDIPWVGIRDATSNHGRTIYATTENTNDIGISNSSARVLPANTVCLSRTASVGYVVVMGVPMSTSQDFVNWVCGPGLDYRYLKYVLISEKETLLQFASGTTHQTIYFPEVKAFHICLPPIEVQRAVSDLLSVIDDRIALKLQMAETLEATTRAIYKSWFVDFDPVRAKSEGRSTGLADPVAALFPAAFADDGLPEGWHPTPLPKIARFMNGLALQKYTPVDGESSLPVIKIVELRAGISPKSGRASSQISQEYVINDGDHLFSWSGSLMHCRWTHGEGALNQHLFKVTPIGVPAWLTFEAVEHHMESFRAIAAGKAVTMGHIQRHHLDEAMIAFPDDPLLRAADDVIAPLHQRSLGCRIEMNTLIALRDTLLPKLISGDLRIRDAEALVAAA